MGQGSCQRERGAPRLLAGGKGGGKARAAVAIRQYVPMAVTLISCEPWESYVMSVGFIYKMKNKGIPLL